MEQFGLHEQGVRAGGYDLLPEILKLMKAGHIDFTIDQQPYLQGFLPVMQLYLYKISGGVTGPAETDRKSTRLNSSHANISYAVFCLKKKKMRPSSRT